MMNDRPARVIAETAILVTTVTSILCSLASAMPDANAATGAAIACSGVGGLVAMVSASRFGRSSGRAVAHAVALALCTTACATSSWIQSVFGCAAGWTMIPGIILAAAAVVTCTGVIAACSAGKSGRTQIADGSVSSYKDEASIGDA